MRWAALKDILSLSDSGTWGAEDKENGVSILRSTNFKADGTLDFDKLIFRSIDPKKREAKLLKDGDILLEKSGGGPQQPVGRVCLYRGHSLPHSFGNFIARLRPTEEVLSEYLFYFLWQFHATGKTNSYQKQTTGIRNLETKRYLSIDVPVPSIIEQRRIIDILSRAEGIVRLRREAQKKAAEIIPALFIDMFGDPATNPKGWPMQPLGQFATFMSGGTPSKAREDFWQGKLPWVSPKDMKISYINNSIDHINEKVLSETSIKIVPVGSALIVVRGMILIHTVPVACSSVPLTINQDMKAIIPAPSLHSSYLLWLLKVLQPHLLNMVSTAAHGTKKLETPRLESMMIPLPSVKDQIVFSERVAEIQSIQSQQSAATQKAEATFDALLENTFRKRPHEN